MESYLPAAAEDYEYEEEALAGYNPGQVGGGGGGGGGVGEVVPNIPCSVTLARARPHTPVVMRGLGSTRPAARSSTRYADTSSLQWLYGCFL